MYVCMENMYVCMIVWMDVFMCVAYMCVCICCFCFCFRLLFRYCKTHTFLLLFAGCAHTAPHLEHARQQETFLQRMREEAVRARALAESKIREDQVRDGAGACDL